MTRVSRGIHLSQEENHELQGCLADEANNRDLAMRAKIILLASNGLTNKVIADKLSVSEKTVSKWRKRFVDHRIKGLQDNPGRGRPKTWTDDDIIPLIKFIFNQQITDSWSIRSLQNALKKDYDILISTATLQRILANIELRLDDSETWLESRENEFRPGTLQIMGLNIGPPFNAMVLSVNANCKGEQQLQNNKPSRSLLTELIFNNNETVNLQPSREFIEFMKEAIMDHQNSQFCVIVDDSSVSEQDLIKKWMQAYPDRVNVISTPSTDLWLNQVQLMFTILTPTVIKHGILNSREEVVRKIVAYIKGYNEEDKPFCWTDSSGL